MPAPTLGLGDIIKTRIFCMQTNQVAVNVQHWRVGAISGTPAIDSMASEYADTFLPLYKPLMSNQATAYGIAMSRLVPTPATIEYTSQTGSGVGTASGMPMPAQVCGVIAIRTDFAGPKNRGRNYIPFPSNVFASTDETPSAPYLAAMADLNDMQLVVALDDGVSGCTLLRCVYPGLPGGENGATASFVRDKWATQKRRGDYGQANGFPF